MNADVTLDCYGLLCPMPIFKTAEKIKELKPGAILEVIATDEGIKADIKAWCQTTGNEFLGIEEAEGEYRAYIKKSG
ncbi:MAG: SirA family protein [Planctomycetes bacterium RIFCSPHIGHO2_02_FULL_50_42]|nr:MAG: SirA family protein [Planctomycetes bacterium RIFCSPHIGHO2_02_FULL_50_42]OHB96626.1 MAG: SirA family protein [Planctomycetes bacterium RIFCSPLOWO2_02_FULL_50_16]OHC05303.1 MAG: SirA family protein [Planctomycetes bacterium RIFCSPLOWO2_12_FULL_50_35]